MPFHLSAYAQSVDTAGNLTTINAVRDTILVANGVDLRVANFTRIIGVHASGVSLTRVQLQSPALRRLFQPDVRPISRGALTPAATPVAQFNLANPLVLDNNEALNVAVAEDVLGAEQEDVLVWFADADIAPVSAPSFTVRATSATTLVAHTWTPGDITLSDTLPPGAYNVIGARAESAGLIGFRFVFRGSSPRPGGLGAINASARNPSGQRFGGWGVWGSFNDIALPSVEFLSASADTTETVFLDLVKV